MDLSTLNTVKAAEQAFQFDVTHPITGEKTDIKMSVWSGEHQAVKAYRNQLFRKMQKQEFEASRQRKPSFQDVEQLEQEALENALVRMAGWENVQWEGKTLEFTLDNARTLLTACPWLCGQITEESDKLANFLNA